MLFPGAYFKRDVMNKKLDLLWHAFLYSSLVVGVAGVYFSRFNSGRQFLVLMLLVIFYLVWGFAYHHTKGDANRKMFLEYLFIGLIALLAGFLVLVS